jgi:uncharacterized protein
MYYARLLYKQLFDHVKSPEITVLTGARQTGKSTLVKELGNQLRNEGHSVFYHSLEDIVFQKELDENPENLFHFILKPEKDQKLIVIIDEIQYLKDPSRFLKFFFDLWADQIKIVATGSSAFYIDQKFKDSLAGRKRLFHLRPLAFSEYLLFNQRDDLVADLEKIRQNPGFKSMNFDLIKSYFFDYLIYGGYPAVALYKTKEEKIDLLVELKNSILKKDIQDSGVTQMVKFFQLTQLLAAQTGGVANRNELANTLGLSNKTIESYMFILQKSFHIDLITPYFTNIRSEISKMPKVYFNDLGLRNCLINNFNKVNDRSDKGELLENYIYNRLVEKKKSSGQINYWRTQQGNEVDFIVTDELSQQTAYEVKFAESGFRESKYKLFQEHYPTIPLKAIFMENAGRDLGTETLSF